MPFGGKLVNGFFPNAESGLCTAAILSQRKDFFET
jgi:hypothetical protein